MLETTRLKPTEKFISIFDGFFAISQQHLKMKNTPQKPNILYNIFQMPNNSFFK